MHDKRRNIYLKQPPIYAAFQMAIEKGIIKADSASARIETLIERDTRKVIDAMRQAGIKIPDALIKKSAE